MVPDLWQLLGENERTRNASDNKYNIQFSLSQTRQEVGRHIKRFIFCTAKLGKTFTPIPITL